MVQNPQRASPAAAQGAQAFAATRRVWLILSAEALSGAERGRQGCPFPAPPSVPRGTPHPDCCSAGTSHPSLGRELLSHRNVKSAWDTPIARRVGARVLRGRLSGRARCVAQTKGSLAAGGSVTEAEKVESRECNRKTDLECHVHLHGFPGDDVATQNAPAGEPPRLRAGPSVSVASNGH